MYKYIYIYYIYTYIFWTAPFKRVVKYKWLMISKVHTAIGVSKSDDTQCDPISVAITRGQFTTFRELPIEFSWQHIFASEINTPHSTTYWHIGHHGHTILENYYLTKRVWGVRMMTSSNGNTCRVTGLLCGEFTGHRWIPRTKASDAELWCFLWSSPE